MSSELKTLPFAEGWTRLPEGGYIRNRNLWGDYPDLPEKRDIGYLDPNPGYHQYANTGTIDIKEFKPMTDRNLYIVYVVETSRNCARQILLVARDSQEASMLVGRHEEFLHLDLKDLEIHVNHIRSLRPSTEIAASELANG